MLSNTKFRLKSPIAGHQTDDIRLRVRCDVSICGGANKHTPPRVPCLLMTSWLSNKPWKVSSRQSYIRRIGSMTWPSRTNEHLAFLTSSPPCHQSSLAGLIKAGCSTSSGCWSTHHHFQTTPTIALLEHLSESRNHFSHAITQVF